MIDDDQRLRLLEAHRFFLKDEVRQMVDFSETEQSRRMPPPPLQKPVPDDAVLKNLPRGGKAMDSYCQMSVGEAIARRSSKRHFTDESIGIEELSALLFAVQGVTKKMTPQSARRTVPSAGGRHSFETYLAVRNVDGLEAGLYRYLPFDGKLLQISVDDKIGEKAAAACLGQMFVGEAATTFFWTTIPARMEWRYGLASHKVIALDAGHVCQNIYLACTAMGLGTCAIAAYDQHLCDSLLQVDGEKEFTIYVAPVGRL